jgi:hypothetical protein
MDKHMNIEDNIFILNVRIRMIQDLLLLDTDAGLFCSKTMEDLAFIDSSLAFLLSVLRGNGRLLERNEQLFNLAESERQFSELLMEFIHGEGSISTAISVDLREKAEGLRKNSAERRKIIGDLVVETKNAAIEPIVSFDELHELLSG